MCLGRRSSPPPPPEPVAAPPPPVQMTKQVSPAPAEDQEAKTNQSASGAVKSKKSGTSRLKIPLVSDTTGVGVNVPQ